MVIDATVLVTFHLSTDTAETAQEVLYPPRHRMTLPLNGLNNVFNSAEVAFNYHTKLDCNRYSESEP
jgi:hypothetical protein